MKNKKFLVGIIIALLLILAVLLLLLGGEKPAKPAPQTTQTTVLGEPDNQGGEKQTLESSEEETTAAGDKDETDPTGDNEETKPNEDGKETQPTEGDKETQPTEGEKETQPTLGDKETQPTQGDKETQPTLGDKETQPTQGDKETQPTKGDKETQPTQGDKETQPTEGDKETQPTQGDKETQPTQGDKETQPQETTPLPEDLPPTVTIPPETDPESGEEVGIQFPCQVPGYDLVVERLAPYSGMFVEDGSNAMISNVAMIMVKNQGDFPIEYTQITVEYEKQTLNFYISALPAGAKMVVQEKEGKKVPKGAALSATATVVRRADMEMSEGKISVTDNGDNTLTIQNLTNKTIPTVRVFYKYYMEDEDIYVGGIAFTLRLTRLAPHAKRTVQPSHFTSGNTRVVMVLTYETEV